MSDPHLEQAAAIIGDAHDGSGQRPVVKSFFDEPTNTVSYVVHDPATREAAVVDSVLDYDPAAGRTSFASADAIIAYVQAEKLSVAWLLETHAHADHLSAAPYLKDKLGGTLAIGREIIHVQNVFGKIGLTPLKWSIPYVGPMTILDGWNDGKEAPQARRDRRQAAAG